jgi:AraC-like DNA-binding protein
MSVVFRTSQTPATARVESWERALAELVLPLTGHTDHGGLDAQLVTGRVGAVTVTEVVAPAGECSRPARLIRQADHGLYQIDVLARGEVRVEQGGRRADLRAGDIAFVNPSHPVRYRHSDTTHVTVLLPRAMLPLRPDQVERLTGIRVPGDRGAGALVSSLARQLPSYLDEYRQTEAARLGTAVVDLLAVALSGQLDPDRAPDPGRRELLSRIFGFVDEHLGDPGLGPAAIAAAHHISLRYLHKLFQTQQATVAGWIRQRRLERCRRDLLDPAQRDRSVSAIAARWGLRNAAHFSRAFKASYGASPAAYRAAIDPASPARPPNRA